MSMPRMASKLHAPTIDMQGAVVGACISKDSDINYINYVKLHLMSITFYVPREGIGT